MRELGTRAVAIARLWPALRLFLPDRTRRLASVSAWSLIAGFAQAGVLYLLVHVAFSVTTGEREPVPSDVLGSDLRVGTALAAAIGLVPVMAGGQLLAARASAMMSARAQTAARAQLLSDFLGARWELQSLERDGHLQELLTVHADKVGTAASLFATASVSLFNFVALIATAVFVSPTGTFAIVAGTAGLFLGLRPLARRTHGSAQQQAEANAVFSIRAAEAVRLAQEIRVFNATTAMTAALGEIASDAERAMARTRLFMRALPAIYQAAAIALVLTALGAAHLLGLRQIGSLGAVVLLLVRGLTYTQSLQGVHQQSAEAAAYMTTLVEQQHAYRAAKVTTSGASIGRVRAIAFDSVAYSYDGRRDVLRSVSFNVAGGECIGVVGPSGAGKSTLVQILLRLREPSSGSYLLNDVDAVSYDLAEFTRHVAYVPQEPRLLAGSIADNIRFFRTGITDEEVHKAARLAHLHDEVLLFTRGYARSIGEGSDDISGGQKQRLALARALVGEPEVLILDEPTSALDPGSDELIRTTLQSLKGTTTIFIVAHRSSTIEICDRIMVIEHGSLTAFGGAAELAAREGFYRDAFGTSHRGP